MVSDFVIYADIHINCYFKYIFLNMFTGEPCSIFVR
jgi:hypothetical protein